MDFAKERFGGPFTTEQVENVKTFFRILLVLFAIGPVFTLEVPASYFVAPLFGLHFHHYSANKQDYCSGKVLMQSVIEAASLCVTGIAAVSYVFIGRTSTSKEEYVETVHKAGYWNLSLLIGSCVLACH